MGNKLKIGLMVVVDPRIDLEWRRKMLSSLRLEEKLEGLGAEVIAPGKVITEAEEAVKAAADMAAQGACGIIYYTAWFLRANTITAACQNSHLPSLIWTIPDMDSGAVIGFGVTHGSLEEVGIAHQVICDQWNERSKRKMLAWVRACATKKSVQGTRYGQVGGRCLSMMPADADANQWRRQFGIDVDHAEQWTLIHRAEKVPDKQVKPIIREWKKEFASIGVSDEVLTKSAKLYLAGKEMFVEHKWDFAGIKCQFELIDNYLAPCLPISLWNDEGFTVACESDMNAALTMLVLQKISGQPVMFSDIQYLDVDKKLARFLNCGTAATTLAGGRKRVELKDCPQVQGTLDEKTGKHLCKGGACTHFVLPPGEVTLARFGRIKGKYVLHVARGKSISYLHDKKSLVGIGGVWPFAYIQIEQKMEDFIQNLRAHHICIAPGNWEPELRILAKLWDVEVL